MFPGSSLATPLPLRKLVFSNLQALALKSDGTLYAWGKTDSIGSFGDGNSVGTGASNAIQELLTPTRATVLESATSPVVDVAIGLAAAFALRSDGTLWAVGSNVAGELARSDTTLRAVSPAVRIGGVFSRVSALRAGRPYAIGTNKALYWWGYGLTTPQALIAANVENVWAGGVGLDPATNQLAHAGYAQLTDGTVMGWGVNAAGELGNGTTVQPSGPVAVALPKEPVRDIVRGAAVMADGSLYLWGVPPSSPARYYKDPSTGVRTRIGLAPVKVAGGYAAVGLMADGSVVQLETSYDADGAVVVMPKVEATSVARHYYGGVEVSFPEPRPPVRTLALGIGNSAVVAPSGAVRIKYSFLNPSQGGPLVAAGSTADEYGYRSALFSAGFTAAPPPPPGSGSGSGGGSGSTGGDNDALNHPQVDHTFTCTVSQERKTIQVSNGPCISSQRAYVKAVACNEYDSNFTFNSVGRPFYQCLVNNSTGGFKAYYQQYLSYFGG